MRSGDSGNIFSSNQEELYTRELEEQSPVVLNIQQLLDSVENEQFITGSFGVG